MSTGQQDPLDKTTPHSTGLLSRLLDIPRYEITQGRARSRCPKNGYGTNVCVHARGDSGLPGTRQQSPGGWEVRPGETAPGGGGDAPRGSLVPGARPPPRARARRGQQDRREPPAGGTGHAQTASRSRRERASFRAARKRDLPGRLAPPDAAGTARRDPSGPGAGRGATGAGGAIGAAPPPPFPGARRTRGRAGGRGSSGVPAPRRGGEGAPPPRSPGRAGAGGSRPAGWGSLRAGAGTRRRRRGRGRALALRPGQGRTRPAAPEGPAAPRPRPWLPRGRLARGEPAKLGGQTF